MGIKQIEQFSDIILRMLRFLPESSGVTKLELCQSFPHCKYGSAMYRLRLQQVYRLRPTPAQDSAAKDIKTGTKLW